MLVNIHVNFNRFIYNIQIAFFNSVMVDFAIIVI